MNRRIVILGLPYFGKIAEAALRDHGWEAAYYHHPGRNPLGWLQLLPAVFRARAFYLISSRIDRRSPQAIIARLLRKPMLIHWVGTDVVFALESFRAGVASRFLLDHATHIVDAPWLAEELAEMGITADYQPLPVPALRRDDPPPLPSAFTALIYYPVDPVDREVYDADTYFRLVRDFPEIAFRLVPSPPEALPQPIPPNLHASGWIADLDPVYREMTVYIRLTSHDGTSFMAVESLSRARYVIWTHPMPGAIQATGYDAVSAALRNLYERHCHGELPLNEAGRESVLSLFDTDRLSTALSNRLKRLVRAQPR